MVAKSYFLFTFTSQARCKDCGIGHWTVSCPRKKGRVTEELSGDTILVERFLIKAGDPEPEEQLALLDRLKEDWRS